MNTIACTVALDMRHNGANKQKVQPVINRANCSLPGLSTGSQFVKHKMRFFSNLRENSSKIVQCGLHFMRKPSTKVGGFFCCW